jgi:hypothetical protein
MAIRDPTARSAVVAAPFGHPIHPHQPADPYPRIGRGDSRAVLSLSLTYPRD